jgi:VanZ family protein
MRRPLLRTLTLLWLIGILLPLALLGKFWPPFGDLFDKVFAPAWMHLLMHGLLYAVLALLLAAWAAPLTRRKVALLLTAILLVGGLHETLQLLAFRRWPGLKPELFDLAIDLLGALLGLAAWQLWQRRHSRIA